MARACRRALSLLVLAITVARDDKKVQREDCSVDLGIQGLRVLVTAGANGIGLEIARAFVNEGAKVHICDVDQQALDVVAKSDPKPSSTARR